MTWWLWIIIGLALMGAEIYTAGFGVLWFGVAALAAALTAAAGLDATWQLAVFGVGGLVLLAFTRPLMRRWQAKDTPTNVNAMIGQVGTVTDTIGGPMGASGYVRIGSERWRASATAALPVDTRVVVRRVEGVTVVVEPVPPTWKEVAR